jgi:transposase
VAVNEDGRPLRIEITGGHVHDSQMINAFLNWETAPLAMVLDKAYGSRKIRQAIADEGALAVIPSKSNARKPDTHDKNLYAMRNIVERFFCKMKDMRRLATRFEKSARNFLNMIYLFAAKCWINRVHTLVTQRINQVDMTPLESESKIDDCFCEIA